MIQVFGEDKGLTMKIHSIKNQRIKKTKCIRENYSCPKEIQAHELIYQSEKRDDSGRIKVEGIPLETFR